MNKVKDINICQETLNVLHAEYGSDGVQESIEKKDIKPLWEWPYELTDVVTEERDLIRLRTEFL